MPSEQLKYLDITIDAQGNIISTDFHDEVVIQYSNVFIVRVLTSSITFDTVALNILQPNGITLPQKQMILQPELFNGFRAYQYRLSQLDTSVVGNEYSELELTLYITQNNAIITTDPVYVGIEQSISSDVVIGDNTSLTNLADNLNNLSQQFSELSSEFQTIVNEGGIQGPAGEAATINVGITSTGLPGTNAIVTNSGTSTSAVLNFTIPRGNVGPVGPAGPQGPAGTSATINVGTVATGAPGTSAIITNVGTPSNAIFNFTIPRGDTGTFDETLNLEELTNVQVVNKQNGQILKWSSSANKWVNVTDELGVASINGLTGTVTLSAASIGAQPAGDYATLVGGKIPSSQIPSLALSEVFVVDSQVAQDNLTVEEGDVVVRSDLGKSFIYDGSGWIELSSAAPVTSVNGKTGVVVLNAADVGAKPSNYEPTITQSFTVQGVNLGMYSPGMQITAGTKLEDVIRNMLQTIIPATYTSPSLATSFGGLQSYPEVGTSLSYNISSTFFQNDAGIPLTYTVKENSTTLYSSATPVFQDVTGTRILNTETNFSYEAIATYAQGPQKFDNFGNPSGSPIPAGSIAQSFTVFPKYAIYYGSVTNAPDMANITGTQLKELSGTTKTIPFSYSGNDYQYQAPIGTRTVYFALPSSASLNQVLYLEQGNENVLDLFTMRELTIPAINGNPGTTYKLYYVIFAITTAGVLTLTFRT